MYHLNMNSHYRHRGNWAVIELALRHPKRTLLLWVVIFVALGVFAPRLEGALSGGGFIDSRSESSQAQALIDDAFGTAPNRFVAVLKSERSLSEADFLLVQDAFLGSGASEVVTPEVDPALEAADSRTALVIGYFEGSNSSAQSLTPSLQSALEEKFPAEVQVFLTGQPALDYQLNAYSKADATRAEFIVFPLLLIVLLFVFGSAVAAVVPILIAASSLVIAYGIGYLITGGTELSNFYANIVSMIGLAVAVDYSLFILKRFRSSLDAGDRADDAVRSAMQTAGHSVLFSGLAVVISLSALFIPQVMALTSIAFGGIIVTLVALAITMTALPAALVLIGERVDKGQIRPIRKDPSKRFRKPILAGRHPAAVSIVGLIALTALAVPLFGISLQSPVASAKILPAGDPARVGLEILRSEFETEPIFPVQIVISGSELESTGQVAKVVERTTRVVEQHQDVLRVISPLNWSENSTEGFASLIEGSQWPSSLDAVFDISDRSWTAVILAVPADGPDSISAHELVRDLRTELAGINNQGIEVRVGGVTAQGLDFDNAIQNAIPLVILLICSITWIVLAFAFQSALLSLIALVSNLLVVAASLGALAIFQQLFFDGPLNSVTPILLFAVVFGLSMDYVVIIIGRILEEFRAGMAYQDAVLLGSTTTRSAVNSAAIVMIITFLSFTTGQISIVRELGFGLAIAVAIDAFVVRSMLLPAILLVIRQRVAGRKNLRAHQISRIDDSAMEARDSNSVDILGGRV